MRIEVAIITPEELRQAILEWCERNATSQPEIVQVQGVGRPILAIDMRPTGCVETYRETRQRINQ